MSGDAVLYRIEPGERRDSVTVSPVWSQDGGGPLAPGYRHLVVLDGAPGGDPQLLAVAEDGKVSAFRVTSGEPWIEAVDSAIDLRGEWWYGPVGPVWDIVRPFVIGERPHLLAYTAAERGQFAFFPLTSTPELRAERPYLFSRAREPGPTGGFDVVEPIVVGGLVHYMCYGFDSGRVVIYSLQVTATGWEGMAPLLSKAVWVHEWAPKWTRFAFFQLGGGTYFLKTNVGRLNVNIDHVLDVPSEGAVEIAGHLDLKDALDLDIVRPLVAPRGDPGFVTYRVDGTTTFNRFHGDATGWTTEAELTTVPDARHVVPLDLGSDRFVLVY